MAIRLYRLATACARHTRRVIALWLITLVVVGGSAATFAGALSEDASIPGTESFDALQRLGEQFPGSDGTSAQIVFKAGAGQRIDAAPARAAVLEVVQTVGAAPRVVAVADPFLAAQVSPDGRTALVNVQYLVPVAELTDADRALVQAAVGPARAAGLQVELGGEALVEPFELGFVSEAIGLVVAMIVLLVTLRAVLAAALPLITAVVGVTIGIAGVLALSGVIDMTSTAPVLAVMIGLAVGIDYALFIVSRHRAQLGSGMDVTESIGRATGTAGSAVVFAGLTVVVALAGLALLGIPFLTVMGLGAAATVVIAVAIALTLLPALLALCGERLTPARAAHDTHAPTTPAKDKAAGAHRPASLGHRWVQEVTRRPLLTVMGAMTTLLVMTIPLASLQVGLPGPESAPTDRSDRKAYDLIADGFGPGSNGPLVVLLETSDDSAAAGIEELQSRIARLPGVADVSAATLSPGADAAVVQVTPDTGPAEPATKALVQAIRALDAPRAGSTRFAVTGLTAINIDISDKLAGALPAFLVVIVSLALVLLTVAFRSLLIPVKAVLGFLLTLGATGGAVVAVFQWGWLAGPLGVQQVGPILNFLPVLLVGILFGLAMDYQVFLVSRMREEHTHGATALAAVQAGFTDGVRVVTAAGLVMIAVFAGFFFAHDPTIKSIGFALAFGVLIDAFVVRMTIVPAVMALLGERAWALPRWLGRIVPDIDVEGKDLPALPGAPRPPRTAPAVDAAAGTSHDPGLLQHATAAPPGPGPGDQDQPGRPGTSS